MTTTKTTDGLNQIDLESLKAIRWRVISTGQYMPEGIGTAEIEWENGFTANLSSTSMSHQLEQWGNDMMESDEWRSGDLPEFITSQSWVNDPEE